MSKYKNSSILSLDIEITLLCPNCYYKSKKLEETEKTEKTEKTEEIEKTKKNRTKPRVKQCPDCGEGITKTATYCACKQSRKVNRSSLEQIMNDLKELESCKAIGRKYELSDNTIRKWIKAYKSRI